MFFLELRQDSHLTTGNSGCLSCWPGMSNLPFELLGRAGDCSRVTAGQIDFILACVQKLMFLSRADRDLGVAFQTQPGSQAWSRVEGKYSALLSSPDGYLLEPTEWPKGSQASCDVWREDSGLLSRPCRKRKPSSCDDGGVLWFFLGCCASVGLLTR